MKKLICANQAPYDVCEETVCYPSGSANARNYLELWLPQDAMSFDEFEALCKNSAAMASVHIQTADGAGVAAFDGYTVPAEIAKKRFEQHNPATGETTQEMRLFARMEQLTFIERKLAELGLM